MIRHLVVQEDLKSLRYNLYGLGIFRSFYLVHKLSAPHLALQHFPVLLPAREHVKPQNIHPSATCQATN